MSENQNKNPSYFAQMVGIAPDMRVLCVGVLDFSTITEITAKKDSLGQSRAFINKCTLEIQPGKHQKNLLYT